LTLLTFKNKIITQSTTTYSTTSTTLVADPQAGSTNNVVLTGTQTIFAIYVCNNSSADNSLDVFQSAINVDGTNYCIQSDGNTESFDWIQGRNVCFWIGTLAAGNHTIKGMFASQHGTSVTLSNRTLLIYILDGNEFSYLSSTSSFSTTSGTYVNDTPATLTFTPSGTCKALILYAASSTSDFSTIHQKGLKACINVAGTDYTVCEAQHSPSYDNYMYSIATVHAISRTAISTTINGRVASLNNGSKIDVTNRVLGVLLFSDSTLLDVVNSVTQVTSTSTVLADDTALKSGGNPAISRNVTGELLTLAVASKTDNMAGSVYGNEYGIYVDDGDKAVSRSCSSYYGNNYAESNLVAYAQTVAAGTHNINGRFAVNVSGTAKINTRNLIALWFSTGEEPTEPTIYNLASTISGSGASSATPIKTKKLVTSVSGSGASQANTIKAKKLLSSITGSGSQASNPKKLKLLNSSVTGSGTPSANIIKSKILNASSSGIGQSSATPLKDYILNSSLNGAGNSTANLIKSKLLHSSLTGSGLNSSNPIRLSLLNSSLTGSGASLANPIKFKYLVSTVSGSGSQSVNPLLIDILNSSVTGSGSSSASNILIRKLLTSTTGSGNSSSNPIKLDILNSSLMGTGASLSNPLRLKYLASSVSGSSSSVANSILISIISSVVAGSGASSAEPILISDIPETTIYELASSVAGGGQSLANPILINYLNSSISGIGNSQASPIKFNYLASSVAGGGQSLANPILLNYLNSSISGIGNAQALPIKFNYLASSVSGSGLEAANPILLNFLNSSVAGTGESSAEPILINATVTIYELESSVAGSGQSSATPVLIKIQTSEVSGSGKSTAEPIFISEIPSDLDYSIFNNLKGPFTITIEGVTRVVSVEVVTRTVNIT
jgi:hypothetical protein